MSKKRIFIGILIALLLIAGIAVNIIAMQGRKEIEENNKVSTNVVKDVNNNTENRVPNTTLADIANVILEDELELGGDKYNPADVQDKDGNTVTLETEENKPMVILFWNDTEEGAIDALKVLQDNTEKYGDKITFSAIAVVDNSEEAKQNIENIISENGITIPVAYDTIDASLSTANNVSKIPSAVIINKKGEIINTVTNDINQDVIEANLDIVTENY